ncbi:MlaD family protein [Afifella sp. YEN Y35]|uniref:MlaD family protein n=1 Tax=Afifella sp. YEN Y35 TaxID=3388337 RepID=UPI0039E0BBF6
MESKANTAVIGAFTLAVLVAAFGFIYWMAAGEGSQEQQPLRIVFSGSITGLTKGALVLFNGIKVGDVKALEIDPSDPSRVYARVSVGANTPIKSDTEVSLGFQGVTGVGYIEMVGGSANEPDVWEQTDGDVPVLVAKQSNMQDLMASAREIAGRAESTLDAIDKIVADNRDGINRIISNVDTFSGALSDNSQQISRLIESVSSAAEGMAGMSGKLDGIIAKADSIVAAVQPDKVSQTVDNVAEFSQSLGDTSAEVRKFVDNLSGVSDDVREFSDRMRNVGEKADLLVSEVQAKTGPILEAVDPEKLARTLDNIDRVSGAIDPEEVRTAVKGASDLAATLSARQADIDQFVTRLSAVSTRLDEVLAAVDPERVRSVVDQAETIVASVDPAKISSTVDNVDRISAAIDPERIRTTVEGVSDLAATLKARREQIDELVTRLASVSTQADKVLAAVDPQKVQTMVNDASEVVASVDPQKITDTVDSINRVATTVDESREDIRVILANARQVSDRLGILSAKAEGLLGTLDDTASSEEGQGLIAQARATLAEIQTAAATFNEQAKTIGSGASDFSSRGLADIRQFVNEGRRTVSRLDSLISDLEQNPGRLIFGGDNAPTYRGQRR